MKHLRQRAAGSTALPQRRYADHVVHEREAGENNMEAEIVANLLLVDDDAGNLASLQLGLESDGHHVSTAADAARAMQMLSREAVEIVVTDYEMPGMDGAEFCRQVRAKAAHRELPIVMLSAGPEPVCASRCWTLFFRKPASLDRLTAAICAQIAEPSTP
ncbi:response regulator [Paraburkholderia monticola]|uniref:response regulator n=1 Tax=Paraburkholderia monticola TaxID=1399968 RepID=UPI0009501948